MAHFDDSSKNQLPIGFFGCGSLTLAAEWAHKRGLDGGLFPPPPGMFMVHRSVKSSVKARCAKAGSVSRTGFAGLPFDAAIATLAMDPGPLASNERPD